MSLEGYEEIGIPGIDLRDSIVLGWTARTRELVISLDISVLPEHPRYEKPKRGERACFIRGDLRFDNVSSISGLIPQSNVRPTVGPDGYIDYDTLHGIWQENARKYFVEGDFGEVYLVSDPPVLSLEGDGMTR